MRQGTGNERARKQELGGKPGNDGHGNAGFAAIGTAGGVVVSAMLLFVLAIAIVRVNEVRGHGAERAATRPGAGQRGREGISARSVAIRFPPVSPILQAAARDRDSGSRFSRSARGSRAGASRVDDPPGSPALLAPGSRRFALVFDGPVVPEAVAPEPVVSEPVVSEPVVSEPRVPVAIPRGGGARSGDLRIETDPPIAVESRFTARDRLEVTFLAEPPRASTIRVRFRDGTALARARLRGADGLVVRTAGPRLLGAVIADPEDEGSRDVLVSFDLPVDLDAIRSNLRVRDAAGNSIEAAVEREPDPIAAPRSARSTRAAAADDLARSTFRIGLPRPTPGGTSLDEVRVEVAADLRSTAGPAPAGVRHVRTVAFLEPVVLADVRASTDWISLRFDRRLPLPVPSAIRLEPPVPFQTVRTWHGFRLVGDFPPGRTFTLHLERGFPGTGRSRLLEPDARTVRIPDARPDLRIAGRGRVLSSAALPFLRVEGVNVAGYRVRAREVYENNLVRLAQDIRRLPPTLFAPHTEREFEVVAARNERFVDTVDLVELVGRDPSAAGGFGRSAAGSGVWLVEVRATDSPWVADRRVVSFSDLAVTLRTSRGRSVAHVARGSTAEPAAGAIVTLRSDTNQVMARAVAGLDGVARLDHEPSGDPPRGAKPYLVSVETSGDATFLDRSGFEVALSDPALGGRPYHLRGLEADVGFDRGVARPGEELRATLLVRDASGDAPVDRPLEVRWFAPDGTLRRRETLRTPASGLALLRYATAPADPTGAWRVEVRDGSGAGESGPGGSAAEAAPLGEGSVLVAAFVPDRLEGSIELQDALHTGAPARVTVRGRWLEGGPAAGRPIEVFVRFDTCTASGAASGAASRGTSRGTSSIPSLGSSGSASGWNGSGDAPLPGLEPGFSLAAGDESPPPGALRPIRAVLDEDGEAVVRFDVPPAGASPQLLRATVLAEIEDPSGRPVVVSARAPVTRPDFLLAVRRVREDGARGDWGELAEPGAGALVEVRLVRPDGRPWPHRERVDLRVDRFEWERVFDRRGRGRFDRVRAAIESKSVEVEGGRAVVRLASAGTSRFDRRVIVATCGTRRAETGFGGALRAPDELRVAPPSRAVEPGDEARVTVDCPVAGTLFVTLEGAGIHDAVALDVPAGPREVELRVPPAPAHPNYYAVATLRAPLRPAHDGSRRDGSNGVDGVDGLDGGGAAGSVVWRIGAVRVPVAAGDRVGEVVVDVTEEVEPGAELRVGVRAEGMTDAVIAVVDDGILRTTGHRGPDPRRTLLAARALDSGGQDTGNRWIEPVGWRDLPRFGGGRGAGVDLDDPEAARRSSASSTIETVALTSGVIRLDAQGRGEARFEIPEYEGRLRVFVVAAGPRRFGRTEAAVLVRSPLGLRLALPRFAAPGDESRLVVTLRDGTESARRVALSIAVEGGDREAVLLADAEREVELAPGGTASFSVPVRFGASPGRRTFRVTAVAAAPGGGATAREVEAAVVVRPPSRFATTLRGFAGSEPAVFDVPETFEGKVRVRVVLDTRPDLRLLPSVESLLAYPYGCAEQTASRTRAVLACRSLFPRVFGADGGEAEAMVRAGLERLASMRTAEGGLAFWPGSRRTSDLASLFGLDVFLAARDAGFEVDAALVRGLGERLAATLDTRDDLEFRCRVVEVLSRLGTMPLARPIDALVEEIREEVRGETAPGSRGEAGGDLHDVVRDVDRRRAGMRAYVAAARVRIGDAAGASELVRAIDAERRASLARDDDAAGDRAGVRPGGVRPAGVRPAGVRRGHLAVYATPKMRWAAEYRARLLVDPGDDRIASMAAGLAAMTERPARSTTRERAAIVLALAEGYRTRSEATASARVRVLVDGVGSELAVGGSGRSGGDIEGRVGHETRAEASPELVLDARPDSRIEIRSEGPPIYGMVEIRGFRKGSAAAEPDGAPAGLAPLGGLAIERRVLDTRTGEPADALRAGRVYEVRLTVEADEPIEHLLVRDFVPAGLEIEDPRLGAGDGVDRGRGERTARSWRSPEHLEIRDDRILFFETNPVSGTVTYAYRVRAVFPGSYATMAPHAEALYRPGFAVLGAAGPDRVAVEP